MEQAASRKMDRMSQRERHEQFSPAFLIGKLSQGDHRQTDQNYNDARHL